MYLVKNCTYFCNYKSSKPNKIERKTIGFYHLTFVLAGSLTYVINGTTVVLQKNDALLLVPGTIRERLEGDSPAHFVIFNFNPTKNNEIPSNLIMRNAVNQTVRNILELYPYTHFKLKKYKNNASTEKTKTKIVLPNLFNCILTELLEAHKLNIKNRHVAEAVKYINDNITRPLSLANVSKAVHLTKEYTAKVFKKNMHTTVSEYVNEQKLRLAKEMLSSEEMSLQEISHALGYENYGYFSKIFKKQFGISPIKMKNELKNN